MAKSPTSTTPESTPSRRILGRANAGTSGGSSRSLGGDLAARRANAPSIPNFFREALAELKKVTWPTRQEAINLTIAVIGMTAAIALFLGLIDAGLDQVVTWILGA